MGDLLFSNKPRTVLRRTERMIQRRKRIGYLHWSVHPQKEPNETQKYNYSMDWLQKINDIVTQSWIINSPQIYKITNKVAKFIQETIKKNGELNWPQEEKFNWSDNPKRYILRRISITFIIGNRDDGIQSHNWEMHRDYELTKP